MKKIIAGSLLVLSACSDLTGPSVPQQNGATLDAARAAVRACAPEAPQGGRGAVVGGYVTGVILGGIIVGPLVVVSVEDDIRAHGEASAVDRCLETRGFTRRDLTEEEVRLLNASTPQQRRLLLDHLVGGGTLSTFGAIAV